jgi:hypothetical protein
VPMQQTRARGARAAADQAARANGRLFWHRHENQQQPRCCSPRHVHITGQARSRRRRLCSPPHELKGTGSCACRAGVPQRARGTSRAAQIVAARLGFDAHQAARIESRS